MSEGVKRHVHPITVYNAEKKEMIGVFDSAGEVCKYLFRYKTEKNCKRIVYATKEKNRITDSVFDFPVAVRLASEEQKSYLGNLPRLLCHGYPSSTFNMATV